MMDDYGNSQEELLRRFKKSRLEIKRFFHSKYVKDYIRVGDFSYGTPHIEYFGNENEELVIGKFCSIAKNVEFVLGGSHRTEWNTTYPFNTLFEQYRYIKGHPCNKGGIIVGNDVWFGGGCKILSGVTIGDGAVIGANALVVNDVEPYSIVGGVPAKHLKYRFSEEIIEKMLKMKWWDWPDEVLCIAVPLLQSDSYDELWNLYLGLVEDGIISNEE